MAKFYYKTFNALLKNVFSKIFEIPILEHTASYLRNLTHQHSIGLEAIESIDHTMTKEKIQEFFKVNIINNIKDYILLNDTPRSRATRYLKKFSCF